MSKNERSTPNNSVIESESEFRFSYIKLKVWYYFLLSDLLTVIVRNTDIFKEDGATNRLNDEPQKLVDFFIFLGSNMGQHTHREGMDCYRQISTIWKWKLWWNKTEILPNCSRVSTILWLHHLDFNEVIGEKARWEPHKDAEGCFQQILKAGTPHQTAAVQPLASRLTSHSNKTKISRWRKRDELINEVIPWGPTHRHASVGRTIKTYIPLCADNGCPLEDLSRVMNDRDG